jgi:hypothetical protein
MPFESVPRGAALLRTGAISRKEYLIMADIILVRPDPGKRIELAIPPLPQGAEAPAGGFVLKFSPLAAEWTQVDGSLVLAFEDGGSIVLKDFYSRFAGVSLPDFVIGGEVLEGQSFFDAVLGNPDLMPAAGPGRGAVRNNRYHVYDRMDAVGGLTRLDGLAPDTPPAESPDDETSSHPALSSDIRLIWLPWEHGLILRTALVHSEFAGLTIGGVFYSVDALRGGADIPWNGDLLHFTLVGEGDVGVAFPAGIPENEIHDALDALHITGHDSVGNTARAPLFQDDPEDAFSFAAEAEPAVFAEAEEEEAAASSTAAAMPEEEAAFAATAALFAAAPSESGSLILPEDEAAIDWSDGFMINGTVVPFEHDAILIPLSNGDSLKLTRVDGRIDYEYMVGSSPDSPEAKDVFLQFAVRGEAEDWRVAEVRITAAPPPGMEWGREEVGAFDEAAFAWGDEPDRSYTSDDSADVLYGAGERGWLSDSVLSPAGNGDLLFGGDSPFSGGDEHERLFGGSDAPLCGDAEILFSSDESGHSRYGGGSILAFSADTVFNEGEGISFLVGLEDSPLSLDELLAATDMQDVKVIVEKNVSGYSLTSLSGCETLGLTLQSDRLAFGKDWNVPTPDEPAVTIGDTEFYAINHYNADTRGEDITLLVARILLENDAG